MYYYKNKGTGWLLESNDRLSAEEIDENYLFEISEEEFSKKEVWMLTREQYDKLNPPQESTEVIEDEDGVEYVRLLNDDENWQYMGYVPTPKTRFEVFRYHILHGILMKYPFHKVLLYAIHYSGGDFGKNIC